jgi:hypothetical protein
VSSMDYEDPVAKYRREADELEASRQRERRAMQREHRAELRQRERDRAMIEADIDGRIEAAILREREFMFEVIGQAMGEFVRKELTGIDAKLADLERLLNRLREMSAAEREQPIDLPRVPLRSARNVN